MGLTELPSPSSHPLGGRACLSGRPAHTARPHHALSGATQAKASRQARVILLPDRDACHFAVEQVENRPRE